MVEFAIEGATHGCKGCLKRKDLTADQQVAVLGSDRMPEHAFGSNCHLGHQVCPRQGNALCRRASQRNSPDHPVLIADLMGIEESAELLSLRLGRHCRSQAHTESLGTGPLDSLPGARPRPLSTMAVVALRRRTVEADLQGDALARQRAQRLKPTPYKQHAVSEDRGWRRRSARNQDLANIRQHERLAAGYENFADAKFCRLDRDPPHARNTKRTPWSFGRRAHTTIVTAQVAVEVGVKPKARTDRSTLFDILWGFSIAEHPAGATRFDLRVDQSVAREAAPRLKFGADARIAAGHGHKVAPAAATQSCYQICQETRSKCLGACVKFNVHVGSHGVNYRFCRRESKMVRSHLPGMLAYSITRRRGRARLGRIEAERLASYDTGGSGAPTPDAGGQLEKLR